MSSPIAKIKKGFFDKLLISIHRKTSHSKRVSILSTLFLEIIQSVNADNKKVSLLDVGCGDMTIAKNIASRYKKLEFTCIDIYPNVENWDNYFEFNGKDIPFEDNRFDVALLSDVLHHDFANLKVLLEEVKRVSDYIIIKDHFEYGFWSRTLLQLADFIGNYGYGVSIPKKYFTKKSFSALLKECNLKEIKQLSPIELYNDNPVLKKIFISKYQFISVIK